MWRMCGVLAVLVLVAEVQAECGDVVLRCPTGEPFTVPTCWSWFYRRCQICASIKEQVRAQCRRYACGGSYEQWLDQHNGCSAPFLSKLMTKMFGVACAIHDICYVTRRQRLCDRDFRHNMIETCRYWGAPALLSDACRDFVDVAYEAVNLFGAFHVQLDGNCTEIQPEIT